MLCSYCSRITAIPDNYRYTRQIFIYILNTKTRERFQLQVLSRNICKLISFSIIQETDASISCFISLNDLTKNFSLPTNPVNPLHRIIPDCRHRYTSWRKFVANEVNYTGKFLDAVSPLLPPAGRTLLIISICP